jgi:hypothetical protein
MLGPSHRTAGLLAAGALVVGWLSASLVVPPSAISQSREAASRRFAAPPIPPIELASVAAPRLRPSGGRNPFAFGAPSTPRDLDPADRGGRGEEPAAIANESAAAAGADRAAPVSVWRIAGVAFDAATGHTAIVVGDGRVHLLKVGDQFAGAEVIEITASQVTLNPPAGDPIVLRLP